MFLHASQYVSIDLKVKCHYQDSGMLYNLENIYLLPNRNECHYFIHRQEATCINGKSAKCFSPVVTLPLDLHCCLYVIITGSEGATKEEMQREVEQQQKVI